MKQSYPTIKQRLSVFELLVHTSFLPVLLTALAAVAAQCAAFAICLSLTVSKLKGSEPDAFHQLLPNMEFIIDHYFLAVFTGVGLLMISYFLSRTGGNSDVKTGYTMRRLAVRESDVLLTQFFYNSLCLFFYWAAMLGGVFGMYGIYIAMLGSDAATSQTLALSFLRCPYIHGILPVSEPLSVVTNLLLILALGFICAAQPYHSRRGRKSGNKLSFLSVFIVLTFSCNMDSSFYRSMTLLMAAGVMIVTELLQLSEEDDEEVYA